MDFYAMDENSRKSYLDDGLHMTEYGYDQLAGHIAGLVQPSSQVSKRH
jgi:lysophospholipase L1-like esterase